MNRQGIFRVDPISKHSMLYEQMQKVIDAGKKACGVQEGSVMDDYLNLLMDGKLPIEE